MFYYVCGGLILFLAGAWVLSGDGADNTWIGLGLIVAGGAVVAIGSLTTRAPEEKSDL